MRTGRHLAALAALGLVVLALCARAGAATTIDYVEHIFGVTNVNAVGGHGGLTCGVSADGDLSVLSWPGPGFADQLAYLSTNDLEGRDLPHFGALPGMGSYLGLLVTTDEGTRLTWLRDAPWTNSQGYAQPDAPVPVTTFEHAALGLTVTVTDVVAPDVDVLTRGVHVVRSASSPVTAVALVVYENLSPTLSQIPEVPIADWALEAHNDFLAVWDEASRAILHLHPGDHEVFSSVIDLAGLGADVDFGAVEALLRGGGPPAAAAVDAFVAAVDSSYAPGVAALVTTEPEPAQHQVGADATPICAFVDHLVDNVLALHDRLPVLNVPIPPAIGPLLRCVDQLPALAATHGWTWQPRDALADLGDDGALSGAPVAAAQTNGALITPLPAFRADATDGAALFAFGATRAAARAALAGAQRQPFAARKLAAEQAAHDALARAALPDPALGERVRAVALRALVNIYVGRDRTTGAFLAAVTRQPPYALDWPRDGAFISLAAQLAGHADWVTQRDLWYAGLIRRYADTGNPLFTPDVTTDPDTGLREFPAHAWEMNYYVNGDPGGTVRFEIDNTALHVWSTAVQVAALTGTERAAFLAAVWPTDRQALDLLVRWREAGTGLPALANEDDNFALTSTLHGAVAVYTGLRAGARLAHAAHDDASARRYLARADELRAAIDATYYDSATGLFRAERGLPGGPKDSIAGWDTGWLVWPARLLAAGDPRMEHQLDADLTGILAILRGAPGGGTYTAKNVLAAALSGAPEGARAKAREAVQLLAALATPGTDAFGEVYLPVAAGAGGPVAWSNRTATPHVWEGALFYLAAMALTDASRFDAEEAALPLPEAEAGCGCRVGGASGEVGGGGLLVAGLVVAAGLRRRRAARRLTPCASPSSDDGQPQRGSGRGYWASSSTRARPRWWRRFP